MKVLAFDQATKTGWSVFQEDKLIGYGVTDFSHIEDWTERVSAIKDFAERATHVTNAEVFGIEDVQKQVNTNTFKKLSELKGVIENMLFENEYLYFVVSATQWKATCKIKGRKREIQKANAQKFVKEKFGIDVTEDEADAICIGYHISTKLVKKIKKAGV